MYTSHTKADKEAMLKVIGIEKIEDLFQCLPDEGKFTTLNLPDGVTEMEAMDEMQYISSFNETTQELVSFLGAGAYNHFIPAGVSYIHIGRAAITPGTCVQDNVHDVRS